jgi:hypothetical protein
LPGTVAAIAGSSLLTTSADWRPALLAQGRAGRVRVWVGVAQHAQALRAHDSDGLPGSSDRSGEAVRAGHYVEVQLAAAGGKGEWSERCVALACDWPGPTCFEVVAERPIAAPQKKKKVNNQGTTAIPAASSVGSARDVTAAAADAAAAMLAAAVANSSSGAAEGRNDAQRRALTRLRQQRGFDPDEYKSAAGEAGAALRAAGTTIADSESSVARDAAEGEQTARGNSRGSRGGRRNHGDGSDIGDGNGNGESALATGEGGDGLAHPEPGAVRRRTPQGAAAGGAAGGASEARRLGRAADDAAGGGSSGPPDETGGVDASVLAAARETATRRAREKHAADKAAEDAANLRAQAEVKTLL